MPVAPTAANAAANRRRLPLLTIPHQRGRLRGSLPPRWARTCATGRSSGSRRRRRTRPRRRAARSTGRVRPSNCGGPEPNAHLAWFESLAALAEAAVLDDDLGCQPPEPEPAVRRDGERLHAVAPGVGDDLVEHPGDERGRVACGQSDRSRFLQSSDQGEGYRRVARLDVDDGGLDDGVAEVGDGEARLRVDPLGWSSTAVELRAASASARPAARRKSRRRWTPANSSSSCRSDMPRSKDRVERSRSTRSRGAMIPPSVTQLRTANDGLVAPQPRPGDGAARRW